MPIRLADSLPPIPCIRIVDVGAMLIGDNNARADACERVMQATTCDLVGFEPQPAECARLQAQQLPGHTYLPYFIGDGSCRTFHECNFAATSSLFEPDGTLMGRFQNLSELVQVVATSTVQTVRLDDIPQAKGTDFLKVDVQGAELLVFEGAVNTLRDVLVINTEVEFVALYKNQPLFADIDAFLRRHGFMFHRFAHTLGRTFKPLVWNNDPNSAISQWLWGDAVYVKDFTRLDDLTGEQLIKLAAIMHAGYSSIDLAAHAMESYDRITGSRAFAHYLASIARPA